MSNQKRIVSSFIIFVSLFFSFSACMKATLAPYQEKKQAMESLEKAKEVKAETYAEKPYLEASTLNEEGSKLIVDKGKSPKNTQAKNKYNLSIKQSEEAYSNALVFYVKELVAEGSKEMQDLQGQNANRELKNDFEETQALLNQAINLGEKKEYEQAYEVLKSFKKSLEQLKENFQVLSQRGNAFLLEMEALLNEAKAYKADVAFPSEYQLVSNSFIQLQDLITQRSYQEASELGPSVKEGLEGLIAKTKEKAILAQKAYQQAKDSFKKATEINVDVKEEIDEKNDQSVKEYYETFKNKK